MKRNPSSAEFEGLLRQHIRRRPVPSSLTSDACQGIDLDLATAYLERSLSGGGQERFEGHLVDCLLCRQQLMAIARMGEEMASTEVTVRGSNQRGDWGAFPRWIRHQVQEAIDRLQLALEWGGSGGQGVRLLVTASLLLLVVGAVGWQLMRRGPSPREMARELSGPELPSTTQSRSGAEGGGVEELAQALPRQERPRVASPTDETSLSDSPSLPSTVEGTRPARSAPSLADRNARLLPARPLPSAQARATRERIRVDPPSPSAAAREEAGREGEGPWIDPTTSRSTDVATRISPLSQDNPMRTVAADDLPRSDRPSQFSNRIEPSSRIVGFVPPGRALSNGRLSSGMPVPAPSRRVLDKTFHLSGGWWVDELYLGNLRVRGTVRLKVGTEEYEAVLREHPTLSEYFQLRPVTVVWQGIVYRVVE